MGVGCSSFQMASSLRFFPWWLALSRANETTEPLKAEFGVSRAFPLPHSPGENEVPCLLPPSTRSTNKPYFHESLQVTTGAAPRQQVTSNRRTSSWVPHNPFQLPDHFVWNLLLQNKILFDHPSVVNCPSPPFSPPS